MTQSQSADTALPTDEAPFDLALATERLFQEIADMSGSPMLKQSMEIINNQLHRIRPYDATIAVDREAEYQALVSAWRRRDKNELQRLLVAYFKRRYDAAEQVEATITRPH